MTGVLSLILFMAVIGYVCHLNWDAVRRLFFDNCRHRIPYESICVECRAREDRRG